MFMNLMHEDCGGNSFSKTSSTREDIGSKTQNLHLIAVLKPDEQSDQLGLQVFKDKNNISTKK